MQEKSTLVSIVVPIYNCERFISDTLECILSQTYKNLEIICVSDGCTDHSIAVIRSFAKKDSRIVIIENHENAGAATRRNQGLKIASGEWVTFWDADDLYETTYVADMLSVAGNDTQLVICDYDLIGREDKINSYQYHYDQFDFNNVISCAPCNKMVRRKFLMKEKIVFQNLPNCNDLYFSTVCLLKAEYVKYLDKILWHYRFEQSDNTSRKREKKCYIVSALDALYDVVESAEREEYMNAFARFARQHILGYRKYASFRQIIQEYEENCKDKWNLKLNLEQEFYLKDTSCFSGKRIVIVCVGGVGTDYYLQLVEEGKIIVGCFDNGCKENTRLHIDINPVEKIVHYDFDIAIIAVRDDKVALLIKEQLTQLGINKEKIWWQKPERVFKD